MDKVAAAIADFSGPAYDASGSVCQNLNCFVAAQNSTPAYYKDCCCNSLGIPFKEYPEGKYTVQLHVSNWQDTVSAAYVTVKKMVTNILIVTIKMFTGNVDRACSKVDYYWRTGDGKHEVRYNGATPVQFASYWRSHWLSIGGLSFA